MVTRCLFGILVFGSDSDLIYRFLTDDLIVQLHKRFVEKGYIPDQEIIEEQEENQDLPYSIDDVFVQHFSTLINFFAATSYRNSPIRRITLESNIQIFFDEIGENRIVCMTDESFNTIIVLKTINLFKALIKFHLGGLPFTKKSETVQKLIDRISSSLQHYLNNITTNQALLFESCEYLHINSLIRQQCLEACTTINHDVQFWLHVSPTVILMTCKDKIVYMYSSNDQNRPSNSDLFLLLLNNTSRSIRKQFKLQQENSTSKMAHTYKTKFSNTHQNVTNSARTSAEILHHFQNKRAYSLPNLPQSEPGKTNNARRIEVVFMKTSNKTLAPFTMYTITLTNDISALILVEWKSSSACSHLSELIHQLDSSTNQLRFPYTRLNDQVKLVENNSTIRGHFDNKKHALYTLSRILNDTQIIYKTLPRQTDIIDEEDRKGQQIIANLTKMMAISINVFHYLFFESDEYTLTINETDSSSSNETILPEPSMIQTLRSKITSQLADWFSFIEIKSQRNITMSFCHSDFSGLVHFALIDRSRGLICTPALYPEDYSTTNNNTTTNEIEQLLEKKILAFELECLSALQRGCTSYTMTDEHFTYNYTLRLQESNGASMRLYKPFIKSQPPGILHFDFYKALAYENYSSLTKETPIACFELICVHLRIVPSSNVREQCEQLWPKLMEFDE